MMCIVLLMLMLYMCTLYVYMYIPQYMHIAYCGVSNVHKFTAFVYIRVLQVYIYMYIYMYMYNYTSRVNIITHMYRSQV